MDNHNVKRFQNKMNLVGSEKNEPKGKMLKTLNPDDPIEVTIRLRRKSPIEPFLKTMTDDKNNTKFLTRDEYGPKFGSSNEDINLVEEFANQYGLTVLHPILPELRKIILKGSIRNFSVAFEVKLANFEFADGHIYRCRIGGIKIPVELDKIVTGVLGLDNRPQADPKFRTLAKLGSHVTPADANESLYATELPAIYQYPAGNGAGQCIGIIELGGGYNANDINAYFDAVNLTPPLIKAISVDGTTNSPSTADSADGEVALDIQVAGSIAPGASIVVYFAQNTDDGFLNAITTAIHDSNNNPSVISISWGSSEDTNWTDQSKVNFNEAFQSAQAMGVTITIAAGDHGSTDNVNDGKPHVDFPGSSPYVLSCGGTYLNKATGVEVVWNDNDGWAGGGGMSAFSVPDYQNGISINIPSGSINLSGRGVPDIAANADSNSGYKICVDGQWQVIGGTSAVAPLMAGFVALANQKLGRQVGFINPKIYAANAGNFKAITVGNNDTGNLGIYSAGPGWNACAGLGVPLGSVIGSL